MNKPPHILMIQTDDQRFDTISALGNPEIDTPNLDRLVRGGTAFTHAHNLGAMHEAVCIPSRAMMLTGRTLFSLEGRGQRIPPEHIALPEWFRAHGYTTAQVGKWHQDRTAHARCFSTGSRIFGFKEKEGWYEACNGHWHIPVHDYDPQGGYDPDGGFHDPPLEPFAAPFETCKRNGRHSAEVFTDAAVDFLRNYPATAEARDGKPFLLYLSHIAPHDPRQYPERFKERYNADTVTLPPNFAIEHPFDNGELLVRDELLEAHPRRPERIRQHLADYYALIAFVDEQVGRVLDALEASGQADNTIVVFFADHGLAVGQHGLMGKQNLYDHSLRVPLIFRGPGVPENQRAHTLCALADLFPTLCDLTGQDVPESVEGRSLAPAMRDPGHAVRDLLHFAYKDVQLAVRMDGFKRIGYQVKGVHTVQLFDLERDPYETCNLADDPVHRETLERLGRELDRWKTSNQTKATPSA
ncbi:MAG: sulfatase-like hydrolase/transferase [Verrucomicrobia bacterium]|nr:sulfatase-like hydrolase/transferase [Verrucomicrobiota bacterium]MCH8514585.1 sulfatase-like hydrolase/transferase [Kiritimatiellia bacterium]